MSLRPTHNRDHITQVNAAYHDAIVHKYDNRLEAHSPAVREWLQSMLRREVFPALDAVGTTARAIDFGCGSGYLEGYLKGRDLDLLGLDVSAKMLDRARVAFPKWRFEQADAYSFKTDERFHLVMENAVLHHLVDYEQLVDTMAELTLPGGILFLGNEPNRLAYKYLAPLAKLWRTTINRYRTEDAERLAGDAEFEALSEYHLFYGQGIDATALQRRLQERHGFRRVTIYYSFRELFSAIEEHYPRVKLNRWAPTALRDGFPLSRNFNLIAQR
ncbi:MAG: class I SAM-dependent methyltransferase [Actinomycetota bacterium]|nr:class I SAM-dependent methyltransferase [Actinomycetota bacterium]